MTSTDIAEVADGYPSWVLPVVALPPVAFAIVSILDAGSAWQVIAGAVGVSVLPWILDIGGAGPPRPVFAAWVAAPLIVVNIAGEPLGVDLSGESHSQFTLMILTWLVGQMAASAAAPVVVATTTATIATIAGRVVVEPSFAHSWLYWLGGVGIALVTGTMLRRQQQTLTELRHAQAALAADAAQRERQRIAREVHDVVGHTLTVTLMHLSAARRALDHDTDAAREALVEAEALGRRSLADIRRTVGLLRADDDGARLQALPDATDLPALFDSYRAAGVEIRAEVRADLAPLDPAVGLTLYRVVQESLSNAAAHAPGAPVEVVIRADGEDLELRIANELRVGAEERSGGSGVTGMGERVRLIGGEFHAGRTGSRWIVSARLPTRASRPPAEVPV